MTQAIPESNRAETSSFGCRMKEYTIAALNEIAYRVEAEHSTALEDLDICRRRKRLLCVVHKIVDEFRRQCSLILEQASIPDSNEVRFRLNDKCRLN